MSVCKAESGAATLGQVYRKGRRALSQAGVDSPGFDADCLFQKAFGLDRQNRILRDDQPAEPEKTEQYLCDIRARAEGTPLQYLLGKWPFLDLELRVGEGVLIPREETELLVRTAAELLQRVAAPRIIDLCSGTGAVALGLSTLLPSAKITAAELYSGAYSYLTRNVAETGLSHVEPVQLDVLAPESAQCYSEWDGIVSNPPYVRTDELPTLQREVRREPVTALEGGADGLLFYRAIAQNWLPRLKPGGVVAVEIGEQQAQEVSALFRTQGITQIRVHRDFNGLERVVCGIKGEKC